MFIQPCYIRKDSLDLRNKLEELGYHQFEYCRDEFEKDDVLAVIEMSNNEPIYTYINYRNMENMRYIDCDVNEELFLAIAALRDDFDINQWFVPDYKEYDNEWFFCKENKIENTILSYDLLFRDFHKATVEELIEHFKISKY